MIQLLIPSDSVHIGVQALTYLKLIAFQRQTLPLGQGMDHLGVVTDAVDVKSNGPLNAVQVIVQAGGGGYEQGGRDAVEPQTACQFIFKQALQQADRLLGFVNGQQGGISLRNGDGFHSKSSF